MQYGELRIGQIEAIISKLGGMEGVRRLLSGELVIKEVEHQLRFLKTINLGTGLLTADDFRRALRAGGFNVGDGADNIFNNLAFAESIAKVWTVVDLCVATTTQLTGQAEGVTIQEVLVGIKHLGGVLCSAEVGPQLRLQYLDQPHNEWLRIAMNPISRSDGDLGIFCVERNVSGLWLSGFCGCPDIVWHPACLWVFVRPCK